MGAKWSQGVRSHVQCAGQQCEQRSACYRYIKRSGGDWASYDLERAALGDTNCPNYIHWLQHHREEKGNVAGS